MKFHHLGIAVNSIQQWERVYLELGYTHIEGPIFDSNQQVYVSFYTLGESFTIELIQPGSEKSPISRFLKNGGGLNHICYEVDDIEKSMIDLRESGAVCASLPKPAKAFNNREVAFMLLPTKDIIELLQR